MSQPTARLSLKVVPGSSRTAIAGWMGDTLRIRVSAPPERGKANAAVEALLSKVLGISRGEARIVSGGTSPHKVIEITGLGEAELRCRLSAVVS